MSAMKAEAYAEAIVDTVRPETLVSDPVIIKVREKKDVPRRHIPYAEFLVSCM